MKSNVWDPKLPIVRDLDFKEEIKEKRWPLIVDRRSSNQEF